MGKGHTRTGDNVTSGTSNKCLRGQKGKGKKVATGQEDKWKRGREDKGTGKQGHGGHRDKTKTRQ